ncbi:toll/interleukin-1 receptor domain-containing protein [Adonisia turfae]|uniref:toll/interleukin-1 receptor domain-containing protein n=1 Tax=Adonisia turfae TaxID=2950184 RepID=UPI0013D331B4|nr:toll/interleukin-1 receptor domain-containing protein [Adonisia turfae]
MLQIFLAHAHEDKTEVMKLYKRLQQQGYKPWMDKKDLLGGQRWDDAIQKAINGSDIFIACLSKRSVEKRGYVQREFKMALNKCGDIPADEIYLVPVRLDDCIIPKLRQQEYGINFDDYQAIDLFETDGFEQLVKSIDHHFPVDRAPKVGETQLEDFGNSANAYFCFISYSSKDQEFAERLYADLQNKGVRCWYAPEDLPIGAKIRVGIDEAIRRYDKLLLILSESSVNSQWVEQEVETALEKERDRNNQVVLFPVRLDNAVMDSGDGWTRLIKNTRNIGDFSRWKDHDAYQRSFERLVRDLKASLVAKG